MNDYEILKDCYKKIKCNFVSSQTLTGFNVILILEFEVCFEFDLDGKFLRIK